MSVPIPVPRPVPRPKDRSRWLVAVVIFVAAANLATLAWFLASARPLSGAETIFPRGWVAVHASTGEIFYGHIGELSPDVLRLDDAYVLEAFKQTESDASSSTSASFSLLNNDPHHQQRFFLLKQDKPLYLNRETILYWESIPESSAVAWQLQ